MLEKSELDVLYEAIFSRKSVRKYEAEALAPDVQREVLRVANATAALDENVPAAFRILTTSQIKGISSAKTPHYLAVYAQPDLVSRTSAAFRLQQMDLWLSAHGYGSCWLGMPNSTQEVATQDGLPFVIMLAFGAPAEELKRSDISQFKRKTYEEISTIAGADRLLEPLRLAPSASNRQPWKASGNESVLRLSIKEDGLVGKLLYKEMRYSDAGIALCHLWLATKHAETFAGFEREANPAGTPQRYEYIYSVKLE